METRRRIEKEQVMGNEEEQLKEKARKTERKRR